MQGLESSNRSIDLIVLSKSLFALVSFCFRNLESNILDQS